MLIKQQKDNKEKYIFQLRSDEYEKHINIKI